MWKALSERPATSNEDVAFSHNSAGLAFDEPLPDVLAVPVTETQLQQLVNIWSDALSLTDLTHIRCILANSFDKPSYADLMRTQTLASLIDETNGRWLAKVIDMGRLVTHLQPIVRSTAPDVVYGYECLLRGQDMDGQIIPPIRLYSTARRAGLLGCLDEAARLTAIECVSRLQLSTEIFINFNPRSIDDSHQALESALRAVLASPIAAERYVFEVVESDESTDSNALLRIADSLRLAGCRIALDDVGAGYNSLNMIAVLKPDYIKLDMEMIRGVDQDDYKARITAKLLELARELGVLTVVEGVETKSEWQWACEHGADFAQGYLFARPAEQPSESQFCVQYTDETANLDQMLSAVADRPNLPAEV